MVPEVAARRRRSVNGVRSVVISVHVFNLIVNAVTELEKKMLPKLVLVHPRFCDKNNKGCY